MPLSGLQPADPASMFAADVAGGLAHRPKRIPSKYFYDARGSALFEDICAQPEYYLTRTELSILARHAPDIAARVGARAMVVEYGSGSGLKTRRLLAALEEPVAYVPVEISPAALEATTAALAEEFPSLELLPLCADFTTRLALPEPSRPAAHRLVFFPGSTLGNFDLADAARLLAGMRADMGTGGMAVVGIDLVKDPALLEAAYNDAAGVTAAFTLNLLERINRELEGNFDLRLFEHRARYNPLAQRIETHIVSLADQLVRVAGTPVRFEEGEAMLVEYSYKYTLAGFSRMAAAAGLRLAEAFTDADGRFAVVLLERGQG
ncbi:MAG: L-histidine N(alpha)-methyltransferase [Xanthomonadales bacterium]|nr:L-histidine N(alpha)-methyltransferase [Xanthomonadales bacterium]